MRLGDIRSVFLGPCGSVGTKHCVQESQGHSRMGASHVLPVLPIFHAAERDECEEKQLRNRETMNKRKTQRQKSVRTMIVHARVPVT